MMTGSTAVFGDDTATTFPREAADRRAVRFWLYAVLVVMFALFLVGGATRITDSGLSITEWKPIHGVVPPLSDADWQEELEKYRQIPEYQQINKGMTVEAFKSIYWWEWGHRLLARGVGFVFALPLIFFWATGRLEAHLKPRLLALLALGGLQGAVGWWMVASGLTERTDVSQYRLATHLTLACLIFAATLWIARGLAPHSAPPAAASTRRFAGIMVLLVFIQIYIGALVAGLDAGLSYNTWPMMDGALVPGDLFAIEPAWRNLFENPKTVQFMHRIGAYTIFLAALAHLLASWRSDPGSPHAVRAILLFAMLGLQALIGIATLISVVPFDLALAHHGFAILVLAFSVAHWRGTIGAYPRITAQGSVIK